MALALRGSHSDGESDLGRDPGSRTGLSVTPGAQEHRAFAPSSGSVTASCVDALSYAVHPFLRLLLQPATTWRLETTDIRSLTVLKDRGPKSVSPGPNQSATGPRFLKTLRSMRPLPLQLLVAAGVPWLVAAYLQCSVPASPALPLPPPTRSL